MSAITTSIFELLKIGPGPSSSHTIGPMKAGHDFFTQMQALPPETLRDAASLQVTLYGSLAATGKGHGTDRAVLAGLLGKTPEHCPPDFLDTIILSPKNEIPIPVRDITLRFRAADMIFNLAPQDFPFSNTMILRLSGKNAVILEKEYYSVGGGFIQWPGWAETPRGLPAYPYGNALELARQLKTHRLKLPALLLKNEEAITGRSADEINHGLDRILAAMETAVQTGLHTEGYLPGPIGLHRKAPLMYQRAKKMSSNADRFLVYLCAYAFAAAEENAAGHIVVTAPTCGSAGVIPGVIALLKHHFKIPAETLREALMASCAFGFIAKQNASISGAEVGCQGEVGVASSMAAALIAYAHDAGFAVAENAAETAMEHHLGMTCDPVKGYVQIPCVERNAMGAVKAYTSYLIACEGVPEWHIVGFDKAVQAMGMTGRAMPSQYRETSEGGLAKCC